MDCKHVNQRPDASKKVWICMDCGADTKPFGKEADSETISESLKEPKQT
jgi:hypothetical protein